MLAVDVNLGRAAGLPQNETRKVLGRNVVARAVLRSRGVYFRSLVMLLQTVESDPIVSVVPGGVGQKPNMIGSLPSQLDALVQERVEHLAALRMHGMPRL